MQHGRGIEGGEAVSAYHLAQHPAALPADLLTQTACSSEMKMNYLTYIKVTLCTFDFFGNHNVNRIKFLEMNDG